MTIRALIIGFFGAMFIAGVGYINDRILELENFNSGHLLPVMVIGLAFLALLLLNPLLFRIKRSWAFRPAEVGVMVVMASIACSIPGRGLMEQFTQCIVMPYHWNHVDPGWQERKLLDYVPEGAFVKVDEENYDRVVTGYIQGAGKNLNTEESLRRKLETKVRRVPWKAWKPPMLIWLPMILLVAACSVCLSLIVHKQWSKHEFLSYPIADFTASLVEREEGRALPVVFRNRSFWIGFLIIYLIRLNNGLCVWFPENMIPVRLTWDMRAFLKLFPSISKVQWGTSLLRLNLFPLVAAFAFFLSTEVSLTLGVTQIAYVLFALPLVTHGVNMSTQYALGGWNGYMRAGAYMAFALTLLYTGRFYYRGLVVKALTVWRRLEPDDENVWPTRFLFVGLGLLVFLLMRLGLELPFAVGMVLLMMLSFLVISRISAETGMFFIQSRWQPIGILMAAFGVYAMNPTSIMIVGLACVILCIDQSQAVMPYLVNGLKIAEKVKVSPKKMARVAMVVYVLGLFMAVFLVLVAIYDFGDPLYNWSHQRVPSMSFHAVNDAVLQLSARGELAEAEALPWYSRLGRAMPKEYFVPATLIGFLLVVLFSFLRLRLPKWPFHPVMFLVWATYPIVTTCHSFLVGWMIKKGSVRFGGTPMVRKLRPFMIGIIAGEIMGAMTFMVVGAVYFLVQNTNPKVYRYFPR
ncbi:MAG: hypothetical protein HN380_03635 [Victivallales bacterium]|nr:hypothetical protein [Victivallales bacterium]